MKAAKITIAVLLILLIALFAGYVSAVSATSVGQPRVVHFANMNVLVETVPAKESGFWSQPIYAVTARNGGVKHVLAGHTVRVGRLNFYTVAH